MDVNGEMMTLLGALNKWLISDGIRVFRDHTPLAV
jgi:hypothetical protein